MDVKARMLKSENVPVIIILKDQPSFKTLTKENAVSSLKSHASGSQQKLAALLKEEKGRGKADKIKQFWIVNAIAVNASPELIEKLSMRDDVASIELDSELRVMEDFSVQVSQGQIDNATSEIRRINATKVWELGIDGTGINVSIIDTGISASHPDIAGRVIRWVDFVNGNNASAYDDNGHGTHVAGTVGGDGSGGTTTGMAPNVSLFGAKVLDNNGDGFTSDVISGIQWSASNGANIISMSLGGGTFSSGNCDSSYQSLADAINSSVALNITVIAAAGNSGGSGVSSPGCISKTIAVGAVNSSDSIASFSSTGFSMSDHGVVAPGVGITSLNNATGYKSLDGTSMATPHVSGAVALLLHAAQRQGTSLTPSQIKGILNSTSVDLGTSGNDTTYGHGRINVSAAILSIDTVGPYVVANPTGYVDSNTAARNGTAITLNATITDAVSGVKNASVNVSSINASLTNISLSNSSGFWTNSSVIVNASDGIYYLNVTAYDNMSYVNNSVQLSVTVDNTLPLVYINQTSYRRGSAANNGSIVGFNASANDPSVNGISAGLKNASVNASLINNTGAITLINQSGFWKGNATFNRFIADGNYSLNATFFDNAGNINNTVQINISIDNTPPSVTNVSLSSQFINVSSFTNISANITSLDTVSQVNQSEVFARVTYPNGTSINYGMNAGGGGLFYYNFTDAAQYGRFNVTLLANDTTGNTNSTQRIQFATAFITNNVSVVILANNSTVVNASISNTTLRLFTNNTSAGAINITQSRVNITSEELNVTNPGIYVLINASDSIKNNLSHVFISVNYTDAEVSSYVESSLRLYRWNTTSSSWDKLSGAGSYPYVNDAGIDAVNNFVWANITTLSEFAVTGDVYVPPSQQSSSGGGGGGGGGGAASGENASNIEVKEKYDLHIFKDKVTAFAFTNRSNPVLFINITGNINAGEINTAVEVLRNTSSLVKAQAPGMVYKNINIWVGTSGFAVPKNIKNAEITFRVEKEWAGGSGSIALFRYDSDWVRLPAQKIREDAGFEYYTGSTEKFSPFAITKLKEIEVTTAAPIGATVTGSAVIPAEKTPAPPHTQTEKATFKAVLTITAVFLVIITTILAAVYILKRKRI